MASPELGQGAFKLTVQFFAIQLQVTLATIFSDLAFFFGSLEQYLANLPMNTAYFLEARVWLASAGSLSWWCLSVPI